MGGDWSEEGEAALLLLLSEGAEGGEVIWTGTGGTEPEGMGEGGGGAGIQLSELDLQ